MQLAAERPHFRAHCRDGSVWLLRMDQLAAFTETFTKGGTFWRGCDAWDASVLVKLADIVGLSVWDEAKIAAMQAEKDEEKARAVLQGDP